MLIGLGLTCATALIALWRVLVYFKAYRRQQELRDPWVFFPGICSLLCGDDPYAYSPYFPVISQKFLFHCFIFISIGMDIPIYTVEAMENPSYVVFQWLYPVRILSYWLLFCAFCLVINLWASLVIFSSGSCWILVLRRALVAICILYGLFALYACVDCVFSRSIIIWLQSASYFWFSLFCVGFLFLMAAAFLIVGCLLLARICRALAPQERGRPSFWATVARLNATMLVCTLCFALRAFLLLMGLLHGSFADSINPFMQQNIALPMSLSPVAWYAMSEWIPHLAPCLALMYLMRNDNAGGQEVHGWGYNQQRATPYVPVKNSNEYGTVSINV